MAFATALLGRIAVCATTTRTVVISCSNHELAGLETSCHVIHEGAGRVKGRLGRSGGGAPGVAWSPLDAGFFADSADRIGAPGEDFRTNHPRFKPENLAANRDRYGRALHNLASELASRRRSWRSLDVLQCDDIVPIPSTRNPTRRDLAAGAAPIG